MKALSVKSAAPQLASKANEIAAKQSAHEARLAMAQHDALTKDFARSAAIRSSACSSLRALFADDRPARDHSSDLEHDKEP